MSGVQPGVPVKSRQGRIADLQAALAEAQQKHGPQSPQALMAGRALAKFFGYSM